MTEPDPSAELARLAEEANVAYERNTALRAAVVMIPGIGGSLDLVLASEAPRIFRERIFKILDAMKESMETVKDSATYSQREKATPRKIILISSRSCLPES